MSRGRKIRYTPDEAARRCLYQQYKQSARVKNRVFSLSFPEFAILTTASCYYCDTPPSQVCHPHAYYGDYQPTCLYNGIDRVDNEAGYIFENCVSCCGVCNYMKRGLSEENFISRVLQIARTQEQRRS